mgnify:CR=1 FL=1
MSSGKKLLRPSDDPVGAAQIVRLTEELDKITQYQRNNDLVTNSLELQETALSSINDVVNRARVLVVQSGNGILSSADKKAIGAEIEQIRNQVLDLMNTQNASGEYIFAGYQAQSQAFEFNPSAQSNHVTFVGDDGTNEIQLSDSVSVQSTSSGKTVFADVFARLNFSEQPSSTATLTASKIEHQGSFDKFHKQNFDSANPVNNQFRFEITSPSNVRVSNVGTGQVLDNIPYENGQAIVYQGMSLSIDGTPGQAVDLSLNRPEKKNLAESLHDMFLALNDESLSQNDFLNRIDDTLVNLDNGLEKIAIENSSLGARMNIAQSVKSSNLDNEIANTKAKASIQDVDYAKASAEFSKQETALEAAFQSFPRVVNLSLFNYIS